MWTTTIAWLVWTRSTLMLSWDLPQLNIIILFVSILLLKHTPTVTSDVRHVWFTVLHVCTVQRFHTVNWKDAWMDISLFSRLNAHFQPLFIQSDSAKCWICSALPNFYAVITDTFTPASEAETSISHLSALFKKVLNVPCAREVLCHKQLWISNISLLNSKC